MKAEGGTERFCPWVLRERIWMRGRGRDGSNKKIWRKTEVCGVEERIRLEVKQSVL